MRPTAPSAGDREEPNDARPRRAAAIDTASLWLSGDTAG